MEGLVRQVLKEEPAPSPAMAAWLSSQSDEALASRDVGLVGSRTVGRGTTMTELDMKDYRAQKQAETDRALAFDNWTASVVDANTLKKTKWGLSLLILVVGIFYASKVCFHMYPEAISVF